MVNSGSTASDVTNAPSARARVVICPTALSMDENVWPVAVSLDLGGAPSVRSSRRSTWYAATDPRQRTTVAVETGGVYCVNRSCDRITIWYRPRTPSRDSRSSAQRF